MNLSQHLSNKKLRVTPFRVQVLEVFSEFNNAVSLHQLESKLGDFDRITLYRTLKTFAEKGIIHEIVMTGDVRKFALCEDSCGADHHHSHSHKHIHFHCKTCSEVFCIEIKEIPQFSLPDFQLESIEIQAKGICSSCRKKL